ncbi:MAG: exodeoxyribonuclease VII small subunit [Paracoccaceae bacterium]|jgi:exodeoxyribonuclease VII small subunit
MTQLPIEEMSFESAMAELEGVVSALEKGDVALEESITLYQRGADLRAHCAIKLKDAEEKVEAIRAFEGRAISTTPIEGL